ncbi:uncharacterized protein NPIL_131711 [Nephila pilipes]|uniref:Uncharacterized protein n=1 Tax=Nephila pilipes TaxID=299642 RepID=A0A8X6UJE3_NEPPI|nr:uncharacterized protein NPIL_131711 [Nephila pilipes]
MLLHRNPATHLPAPEPKFITGYTGFCPDLLDKIGMNYPWSTHKVLSKQLDIAMRLAPTKASRRRYPFQGDGFRQCECPGHLRRDMKIYLTKKSDCKCSDQETKPKYSCSSVNFRETKGNITPSMSQFFKTQKRIFCKVMHDMEKKTRGHAVKECHQPCCL